MRYQPHTPEQIRQMLARMGLESIDELFSSIPPALRLQGALDLPPALDEQSLVEHMQALAGAADVERWRGVFLGAGLYEHYIPQVVDQLLLRGEFLTSYTPYQAEMSQGTLKSIFEFQTMVAEILDLDLANASMYDGAHAAAEALLMGLRVQRRRGKVLVSGAVHPDYRAVSRTYLAHLPGAYHELGVADGVTDLAALEAADLSDVAVVLVQSPNFFGALEDLEALAERCHAHDTLLAVCFNEPLAYALVQPPGAAGADLAVGEGQAFGIAPGLGGPALGVFACRDKHVRLTPGRLVSRTTDADGRDGYVLTLSTREQHIRRERATSNICTNQGLMALAAAIHLSLLGAEGFVELARLNLARAAHARAALCALPGVALAHDQPVFNEFTLRLPVPAARVVAHAERFGIAAGVDLGRHDRDRQDQLLVAVTEMNSPAQIDALVEVVREACSGKDSA